MIICMGKEFDMVTTTIYHDACVRFQDPANSILFPIRTPHYLNVSAVYVALVLKCFVEKKLIAVVRYGARGTDAGYELSKNLNCARDT